MLRRNVLSVALLCLLGATTVAADGDKVVVGKMAPDFEVTGVDGKKFKLSDKLGKDKSIVLMFSRAYW